MKIISLKTSVSRKENLVAVDQLEMTEKGIVGDDERGHKQISLIASESILKIESILGRNIKPSEFTENIQIQGLDVFKIQVFDHIIGPNLHLEVSQIGEKKHAKNCIPFIENGECMLTNESVYCRALNSGFLKVDQELYVVPKIFKILVLTLSDRCFAGTGVDTGGPMVVQKIKNLMDIEKRQHTIENIILPDDKAVISDKIANSLNHKYDLIITTGSTGIGPRDIAPEVMRPFLEKEIPGIMEMIRYKYGQTKPNALISRAIAGTNNKTLLFTIPGSLKAVVEYMDEINKIIFHCFNMLYSIDNH